MINLGDKTIKLYLGSNDSLKGYLNEKLVYGDETPAWNGLHLTAVDPNCTVTLNKSDNEGTMVLSDTAYSTDGVSWTDVEWDESGRSQTVTLANPGDTVYYKNTLVSKSNLSDNIYFEILGGRVSADGYIESMAVGDSYDDPAVYMTEIPGAYNRLFQGADLLTTIPKIHSIIKSPHGLDGTFNGCESLTSVTDFNVQCQAEYALSGCFAGCNALETISGEIMFDTESAGVCSGMFEACTALTNAPKLTWLIDPAVSSSFVAEETCKLMFYGCENLVSPPEINGLPKEIRSNAFSSMFEGCTALTSGIDLSEDHTYDERACENMYCNCTSLVSVGDIGGNINVWNPGANVFTKMFYGCTSLKTAGHICNRTIPYASITTRLSHCCESMFEGCASLESVGKNRVPPHAYAFSGMFKGCTSLTTVPNSVLTSGVDNAEYCYYEMFMNCSALVIGPVLTNVCGPYAFNGAFSRCTSLTSYAGELQIDGYTKSDGTIVESESSEPYKYAYMFRGCTSLIKPPVIHGRQFSTAMFVYTFDGCTSLQYVMRMTADERIGDQSIKYTTTMNACANMFSRCTSLIVNESSSSETPVAWNIPFAGTTTVGNLGTQAFWKCPGTRFDDSIHIPASNKLTLYVANTPV